MTELLGSEVVLIMQNAWLLKYVVAMEVLYYQVHDVHPSRYIQHHLLSRN